MVGMSVAVHHAEHGGLLYLQLQYLFQASRGEIAALHPGWLCTANLLVSQGHHGLHLIAQYSIKIEL